MDIYSLAITHIRTEPRPVRMNAWVEDRYYWNHTGLRFRLGLRGSIAMAAGMIMMLGITLI
ncbi:hypothetical protein G6K98_31440 [Agrobacterium rhizogenes]|nr:hypothetical protein [Rhizobium rhizogenes]NTH62045.1 hypothetical protein [Rhizobium rhizogenes]NTH93671.1 hypothetical protein [Rhizobium rhizogenes]